MRSPIPDAIKNIFSLDCMSNIWLVTHYSGGSSGASSIPFSSYPVNWKGKTVFPAAVHEKDHKYLYDVFEVTLHDGAKGYVHVMDFCNKCHGSCKDTVDVRGKTYRKTDHPLLDIHERAFKSGFRGGPRNDAIPLKNVKKIGRMSPDEIQGLPQKWYIDFQKGCRFKSRDVNCNKDGHTNKGRDDFSNESGFCSWKQYGRNTRSLLNTGGYLTSPIIVKPETNDPQESPVMTTNKTDEPDNESPGLFKSMSSWVWVIIAIVVVFLSSGMMSSLLMVMR